MKIKKYLPALSMWLLFEIIAVTTWLTMGPIFYLFNFTYIGTSIAIGLILYTQKKKYARSVVQLAVGLYMLVYLGIICRENMQIEGFWFYLFLGVFSAGTLHYAIAKIFGPLLFGRGWCGYACWTAMVLDFLPFKTPAGPRKSIGFIRYIVFIASFIFVALLFILQVPDIEYIMWLCFIIGNIIYYIVGIVLAYKFKDNRAFCKYICPITIFLKPMTYFSLTRVRVDKEKCISCGKCEQVCPMEVEILNNSRKRKNGTECIQCMQCVDACPKNALKI
ncbi:MAG: 4Fe-4S binding protein [Candidatus Atribacteria bacterium]|jgi:polyferredoxin|nr:4Fe-4S binding protein [Candidatus Atribacteria bacterium]